MFQQRRLLSLTIAVLCISAVPAWAEDDASNWSVGAGVVPLFGGGGVSIVGSVFPPPTVPAVTVSLEALVSPRAAVMFGVLGSYNDTDGLSLGLGSGATLTETRSLAAASVGLRYRLTSDRSPVDVSVYGLLTGGYLSQNLRQEGTGTGKFSNSAASAGLDGGVLAERRLIENLAVRIGVGLFDFTWTSFDQEQTGNVPTPLQNDGSSIHVGVDVRPSLELRLYF